MTAWLGSYDLDAIDGPLSTPAGDGFASAAPVGGLTARTLKPGTTRVATLTLSVAGETGEYHLSVADALYLEDTEARIQVPMNAGPAFEIRVGAE